MNLAQNDAALPFFNEVGVVELFLILLSLDHKWIVKPTTAVTFVCRYDKDNVTYNLLRKTENSVFKIISILLNTLSRRIENGSKYVILSLQLSFGYLSSCLKT